MRLKNLHCHRIDQLFLWMGLHSTLISLLMSSPEMIHWLQRNIEEKLETELSRRNLSYSFDLTLFLKMDFCNALRNEYHEFHPTDF